ncbi:MAG TPA: hypothetical protein VK978_01050 [Candidatus Saccharimonadales bacterium]|nr:hypothetical protein [Candidatus Saccharimonadales bacterium]
MEGFYQWGGERPQTRMLEYSDRLSGLIGSVSHGPREIPLDQDARELAVVRRGIIEIRTRRHIDLPGVEVILGRHSLGTLATNVHKEAQDVTGYIYYQSHPLSKAMAASFASFRSRHEVSFRNEHFHRAANLVMRIMAVERERSESAIDLPPLD